VRRMKRPHVTHVVSDKGGWPVPCSSFNHARQHKARRPMRKASVLVLFRPADVDRS